MTEADNGANSVDVVLIAMPWEQLDCPSLPLGILQAVLDDAGISSLVRHYQLDFLHLCMTATADAEPEEQLDPGHYRVLLGQDTGLAEWVFAVPPLIDLPPQQEQELLDHLRRDKQVAEETISCARRFRCHATRFLQGCVEDLQRINPRVVAFTMGGPYLGCMTLAKMLKEQMPSLAVICGGAACNGPMGAAMHRAFPWVDLVVRGEGEPVLPEVVRDLLGDRPVRPQPGLCYRRNGQAMAEPEEHCRVDLDQVPTPRYDDYFEHLPRLCFGAELEHQGTILLESARGCWWSERSQCTFCGIYTEASRFRTKSPQRTFDELAELSERYQRLDFEYINFVADAGYSHDLWPRFRELQSDLELYMLVRPTTSREQLRQMRDAGFTAVRSGLESLSTPILKLMRKGTTTLTNIRFLKWCAELGIRVAWNLIYGMPGEPEEEYRRMADLARSITHLHPPKLIPLMMNRFSPHFRNPGEFGLQVVQPLEYYRQLFPCDPEVLEDLAYYFELRHSDGRDPESYIGPLREVIDGWREASPASLGSLRYRRGRGFLLIEDTRPGFESSTFRFGDLEGRIYLACRDGANPEQIGQDENLSVEDLRGFLDELVKESLVYSENGRYLSLAIPIAARS